MNKELTEANVSRKTLEYILGTLRLHDTYSCALDEATFYAHKRLFGHMTLASQLKVVLHSAPYISDHLRPLPQTCGVYRHRLVLPPTVVTISPTCLSIAS